ncbi:tripartite ATP-independent periplasmic transporter DctQ component [Candidatus Vecturithrix granuli]|uniref:Tripartite ATP-independent periplasmic transporter DctQ component n=1 Tax=Vecturithrix granuli TaxID=1499967 RepID=A0A081BZ55_VECG1|nr:tripartite ATP-independent periplasmic transporter DctQ component [Candidatus Vecturithrix granuli]
MDKIMQLLKTASDRVDRIAMWMSILYAFLVTVIVLGSVFLRMAGRAPSWSEEFARWLLIGIAFVSSSIALKRGGHIGITVLVKSIPYTPLVKLIIQISNILVLIFLLYVLWFGIDAAIKAVDQTGDIIPVSVIYVKLQIPLGVLMMIVHVLYYIAGVFTSDDPKKFLLSQ